MTEKKDIVDCRDCVHYGKLECLDCECANLFEKRKVEIAMTRQDAIDYNKNLKMYMKISDQHNPCKFLDENYIALDMAIEALKEQRPHGECNQCRHYEGVHGVQGHAPCSFWGIGGVLSSDYCSRFEKEGERNDE